MSQLTGQYVTVSTLGEPFQAFVPDPLASIAARLVPDSFEEHNRQAELALARLAGLAGLASCTDGITYLAVRQEAVASSRIEGVQATLGDLFDAEAGLAVSRPADVEEVTGYVQGFLWLREQLQSPAGLPLCVRSVKETHARRLSGVHGRTKRPGEIRRSQNWIRGSRPSDAVFVPPPADRVEELLGDLERFWHDSAPTLPPLVRIALVHAQFETIHPFLDGNGRIGRLLVDALLEHWGLLAEPLLNLSQYLLRHREAYYRGLSDFRQETGVAAWVAFFLEAVTQAAEASLRRIQEVNCQMHTDYRRLLESDRISSVDSRLFALLPTLPRLTVTTASRRLGVSFPTANVAVKRLADLGILQEITGQPTQRVYAFRAYTKATNF